MCKGQLSTRSGHHRPHARGSTRSTPSAVRAVRSSERGIRVPNSQGAPHPEIQERRYGPPGGCCAVVGPCRDAGTIDALGTRPPGAMRPRRPLYSRRQRLRGPQDRVVVRAVRLDVEGAVVPCRLGWSADPMEELRARQGGWS